MKKNIRQGSTIDKKGGYYKIIKSNNNKERVMKRATILISLIITLSYINMINVFGGSLIKEWRADNMPVGEIDSYDGLTMIHGGSKLKVQNKPRGYDSTLSFTNCINTGGSSGLNTSESLKYVPKSRALKFTADKKCVLNIYAFSTSSATSQTMTVSRQGEIIYSGEILDRVTKTTIGLPAGDTYYIYSDAAVGVCMIQLEEYIQGDLNFDGAFDSEDIMLLRKVLDGDEELTASLKYFADLNNDANVDENDKIQLENLYRNTYGEAPQIFSEKVWNAAEIPIGSFNKYDGLFTVKENQMEVAFSSKNFGDFSFSRCIKTNGGAEVSAKTLIPKERAVKFHTDAPCKLIIHVMSGSTTATNPVGCVARKGETVSNFNLSSSVGKFEFDLPKADTYYLYSENYSGSMNIYRMELKKCPQGDINGNFEFDYGDLELITEYLKNNIQLTSAQKGLADVNADGTVNETDRKQILNLILTNYKSKTFSTKKWNASDMPMGNIYEYDGLEFIPSPEAADTQSSVDSCDKTYYADKYFRAMVLHGIGNQTKRAIKFTIDKPTLLTFYAYPRSNSAAEKYAYVSDGTKQIEAFKLKGYTSIGSLDKCQKYLPAAGTYYIYSTGTMGICSIELQTISAGDLDADGKLTYNDYTILSDYLNEGTDLSEWQMKFADVDGNGYIDKEDLSKFETVIDKNTYFTDKVWNISTLAEQVCTNGFYSVNETVQIDGLTFYTSVKEETPKFETTNKSYNGLNFEYAYNTCGSSAEGNRSISFNTSGACTATIMLRTATTNTINQTLCVSSNHNLIKRINVLDSIGLDGGGVQVVKIYLDKPGTYQLYSPEGAVRIYYISLSSLEAVKNISSEKELYVTEGSVSKQYLTAENLPYRENAVYSIKYDSSIFDLTEIGFGGNKHLSNNVLISDDIEIVSKGSGLVLFKINSNEKNWSGIVTSITFKAKKTGTSKITYGVDYHSGV